jgi:hypothetical protein
MMHTITASATTQQMIDFVRAIGIDINLGDVPAEKEFVPGICIQHGGLLIDMERLKYPGDILHEAGHLAVAAPDSRKQMDGVLDGKMKDAAAEEMMAIAWSYAAALHIGIDPYIVFHENGYKGEGTNWAENFAQGKYIGVPMLEWLGLCASKKMALEENKEPFPNMLKWVRQ